MTECHDIHNKKKSSILSTSRNSSQYPSILGGISSRSNYCEGEKNLQDININFVTNKQNTSQRLCESTNSANSELSYPCPTDADKSPPKIIYDLENCFGFDESGDEKEQHKHMEKNRDPSFQDFSEISPVRLTGSFSPKLKSDGYLNSTRASVISPAGPKSTLLPLEESRIISGNFVAPVERSRYTFKSKKDAIPGLPSSAYAYTFSTKNVPKFISTKVETNTITSKKRNDTIHNSGQDRFRVVPNENKYCIAIASNDNDSERNLMPLISNVTVPDENERVRHLDDRKRVPLPSESSYKMAEGCFVNRNAFAVLKENAENNSTGGKAYTQTKRTDVAINKPAKLKKQTLVYESVGVKKQLKAPKVLAKSKIR